MSSLHPPRTLPISECADPEVRTAKPPSSPSPEGEKLFDTTVYTGTGIRPLSSSELGALGGLAVRSLRGARAGGQP